MSLFLLKLTGTAVICLGSSKCELGAGIPRGQRDGWARCAVLFM